MKEQPYLNTAQQMNLKSLLDFVHMEIITRNVAAKVMDNLQMEMLSMNQAAGVVPLATATEMSLHTLIIKPESG